MPKWEVIIPYYHRFVVEADTDEEAIEKAHNEEGTIIAYDEDQVTVELLERE